jgi:hypothetical protein
MKKNVFIKWMLPVLIVAGLAFTGLTGCDVKLVVTDDPLEISVEPDTYQYVDLDTGEIVDASTVADTTDWDLKFGEERRVFTNSGDTATAEGSSGLGGVYYVADATAVDADLTAELAAAEEVFDDADADWDTNKHYDSNIWISIMGNKSEAPLNVMTFIGYGNGDGLTEDTAYSSFQYDENQFYNRVSQGVYELTEYVYIIRHGDGRKHSAIQITAMDQVDGNRVYNLKFANLD